MNEEEQREQLERIGEILNQFVEEGSDFTLDLDEWKFQIRIRGPKWKGVVDKPIADFVIDLDKRLRTELAKHDIEIPKSNHGLVALRVDEGSTLAFLEGVPEVLEQIRNFPPKQQMMIFIAFLVAAGVWGAVKWRGTIADEKKEQEETERERILAAQRTEEERIRAEERLETIRALTERESRRELEKPIRGLIGKMGAEDRITLPAYSQPLKKDAAKEHLKKASRSKPRNYYIDHPYTVQGITTRNPKSWRITLSYGSVSFPAVLELSDADVQDLLGSFKDAHERGTKIAPHLQVTAEINAKGVQRATVVGLGQPRERAVRISQAFRAEGHRPPGFL